MTSLLTEIVIESVDPPAAARFWSAALGWELRRYQPGDVPWVSASGDPSQTDLKLVFVPAADPDHRRNRLFVNPHGSEPVDEVRRLLALGATSVGAPGRSGVGEPDGTSAGEPDATSAAEPWVVLADPGGTELTVLRHEV